MTPNEKPASPTQGELAVKALQAEADSAYCRYLDKMSQPPCLGVEHKMETGEFGVAELKAHVEARELYGFHRGIQHALSALDRTTLPPTGEDAHIIAVIEREFGSWTCDGSDGETNIAQFIEDERNAYRAAPQGSLP